MHYRLIQYASFPIGASFMRLGCTSSRSRRWISKSTDTDACPFCLAFLQVFFSVPERFIIRTAVQVSKSEALHVFHGWFKVSLLLSFSVRLSVLHLWPFSSAKLLLFRFKVLILVAAVCLPICFRWCLLAWYRNPTFLLMLAAISYSIKDQIVKASVENPWWFSITMTNSGSGMEPVSSKDQHGNCFIVRVRSGVRVRPFVFFVCVSRAFWALS